MEEQIVLIRNCKFEIAPPPSPPPCDKSVRSLSRRDVSPFRAFVIENKV